MPHRLVPDPRPRAAHPAPHPMPSGRERSERQRAASSASFVLIVDDDGNAASGLAEVLASDGHQVELAINLDNTPPGPWDVVVATAGALSAAEVVDKVRPPGRPLAPEVIVLGAHHDVDAAVAAMHRGASDFLVKPVPPARLRLALGRALERRRLLRENARLRHDLALLSAAQRLLEVLEPDALVTAAAEALTANAGATAVHLFGGGLRGGVGFSELETATVERAGPPRGYVEHLSGAALGVSRFGMAMVLDLGEGMTLCCAYAEPPSTQEQESVLFLARQLGTAVFNVARLRDAADQALRDPLTGLWNATAFATATERLVAAGAPFSLLFVDVDHFKQVNDRFGHLVGSRALVEIGAAVFGCVRDGDLVGRYGGDELVVLLPATPTDGAVIVAERVREAIATLVVSGVPQLAVTATIGVAGFPDDGDDLQAVIEAADRAMYDGKRDTRNQVRVATPVVVPLPKSPSRGHEP